MHNEIISGTEGMAQFLGISTKRLVKWMEENPDFPARKIGHNGAWMTTKNALMGWLDLYVTKGRETPVARPLPIKAPAGEVAGMEVKRVSVERKRPDAKSPHLTRRREGGAEGLPRAPQKPVRLKRNGHFW